MDNQTVITIEDIYTYFKEILDVPILTTQMKKSINNTIKKLMVDAINDILGEQDYSLFYYTLMKLKKKLIKITKQRPFEDDLHKLNYLLVIVRSDYFYCNLNKKEVKFLIDNDVYNAFLEKINNQESQIDINKIIENLLKAFVNDETKINN